MAASLALGTSATYPTIFNYAQFGATALECPANMPAFQTVAFDLFSGTPAAGGSAYLLDDRPHGGGGYVYGSDVTSNIGAWVNGQAITDRTSLSNFCTGTWVRVVLEEHDFLRTTLFAGNGGGGGFLGGPNGESPFRVRNLNFYNRVFTAAEKAVVSGPFPANGVLCKPRFDIMTATKVPDASGNGYDLNVIGQPGLLF